MYILNQHSDINMELIKNSYKYLNDFKKLYLSAFPKEERKSFAFIEKLRKEGKAVIYTATENTDFAGFAIVLLDEKFALIDYLAVNENLRCSGIGSKILSELKNIYHDKCLFLERETVLKDCENPEQRNRRRKFYLNNGFADSEVFVNVYTVEMTLMTYNNDITFEDYSSFLKKILGDKIFNKIMVKTSELCDETL